MKHSVQLLDYLQKSLAETLGSVVSDRELFDPLAPPTIELSNQQLERLIDYAELLVDWSRRVDLIAPAPIETVLEKHIVDSLVGGLHFLSASSGGLLDIGSGAGLPGLPLAIASPERDVILCEPRAKRVAFLREVKRRLGLDNIQVVESRLEALTVPAGVRFGILRAVASTGAQLESIIEALGRSKLDVFDVAFMVGPEVCGLDSCVTSCKQSTFAYSLSPSGASRRVLVFRVSRETSP